MFNPISNLKRYYSVKTPAKYPYAKDAAVRPNDSIAVLLAPSRLSSCALMPGHLD